VLDTLMDLHCKSNCYCTTDNVKSFDLTQPLPSNRLCHGTIL